MYDSPCNGWHGNQDRPDRVPVTLVNFQDELGESHVLTMPPSDLDNLVELYKGGSGRAIAKLVPDVQSSGSSREVRYALLQLALDADNADALDRLMVQRNIDVLQPVHRRFIGEMIAAVKSRAQ